MALLLSEPRTATVRARTLCDRFVLDKVDFSRILREYPKFAQQAETIARERYNKSVEAEHLMAPTEA